MLAVVLPSAATMPIARTNSGKAMIVSATRPTARSVHPREIARSQPAERADGKGQHHRGECNAQVEASCGDDAAQYVAPDGVGPAPVSRRWRRKGVHRVGGERIVWRNPRPEECGRHEHNEKRERSQSYWIFSQDVAQVTQGLAHAVTAARGSMTP
jgi:hypothetical protein